MPKSDMKWTMDPKRFVSEIETRTELETIEARTRPRKKSSGTFAQSLLNAVGPDIETCLPEAKPQLHKPEPPRPLQKQEKRKKLPTNHMLLEVIKDLDYMGDDLFSMFYVELSKEFEKRYCIAGWCDKVMDIAEGKDAVEEFDMETQELPQFPKVEAIYGHGDLI